MKNKDWFKVALSHAKSLPTEESKDVVVFEHGTLTIEIYKPLMMDEQEPHTRDEAYIVVSGSGEYVLEDERTTFKAGDFLFAPAGAVHRFENFTDDFLTWVIFYGPEGGEMSGVRC